MNDEYTLRLLESIDSKLETIIELLNSRNSVTFNINVPEDRVTYSQMMDIAQTARAAIAVANERGGG